MFEGMGWDSDVVGGEWAYQEVSGASLRLIARD